MKYIRSALVAGCYVFTFYSDLRKIFHIEITIAPKMAVAGIVAGIDGIRQNMYIEAGMQRISGVVYNFSR